MSAFPNLPIDTPGMHANGIPNGTSGSPFKLSNSPVDNMRPLKVIVIGAGYSGIYCGIRIPEKLRNVELVIYEKNAGVGGTWYENRYVCTKYVTGGCVVDFFRYLGCACDVPSHSYQYSFEPNRNWSNIYAPAAEIQQYLEGVAKKYSADRFIKLQHQIVGCSWDDKVAKWNVTVKNLATGETIEDQSDVLISARGNLNTPSWPEIEGFETFKGEVMHSAVWNERSVARLFKYLETSTDHSAVMTSRTNALASSVRVPVPSKSFPRFREWRALKSTLSCEARHGFPLRSARIS